MSTKHISREWLSGRVGVAWGSSASAVESGRLLLGAYALSGDLRGEIAYLAHEMGHLIEIDDRRALLPGFGLRYKRVVRLPPTRYSLGIYPAPRTCQAVERECRVIAISARILEALEWVGAEVVEEMEGTLRAIRVMDDWYNIPSRRNDEARREWCRREVAKALKQWPVERVRAEWWRKVVLVTKRLERAERRKAK